MDIAARYGPLCVEARLDGFAQFVKLVRCGGATATRGAIVELNLTRTSDVPIRLAMKPATSCGQRWCTSRWYPLNRVRCVARRLSCSCSCDKLLSGCDGFQALACHEVVFSALRIALDRLAPCRAFAVRQLQLGVMYTQLRTQTRQLFGPLRQAAWPDRRGRERRSG
jgi:hypothetical protein